MKKTISIKDILLTGHFGGVKLGMTKEQVIEVLGLPEFDDSTSQEQTGALFYGRYEFFYWKSNGKIYGFINSMLSCFGGTKKQHKKNIDYSNDVFKLDLSFMKVGHISTNKEVKQWLRTHKISFEQKADNFGNINLCFPSGVTLTFINTDSYWTIDSNNKVEQVESLFNSDDFLLEGIRQYDLSTPKE